jgi:hypothetical protein
LQYKMAKLDSIPEGTEFAIVVEVNGIRNTLDQFMKKQDLFNDAFQKGLDKILSKLGEDPNLVQVEDISSSTKAKEIADHHQVNKPQQPPDPPKLTDMYKSQRPPTPMATAQPRYYTPPPVLRARMIQQQQADTSTMGVVKGSDPKFWPTNTQLRDMTYEDEEYEPEEEYHTHPFHSDEEFENLTQAFLKQDQKHMKDPPKEAHKPSVHMGTEEMRPNRFMPYQQHATYSMQLQQQQKHVSRGPKLIFPEFNGTDVDGWIRKPEKYYELVGVPNEHRVQIAVLYLEGRAEYWWRGTGCNPQTLLWHHFCRMVSDRFNKTSEYDIIGKFHQLKQTGSVMDYVDKFEEMLSQVRRHNPSLNDAYFISSFIFWTEGLHTVSPTVP